MKKVGILTFHYVDNYGAVLQAWALQNVLNRMDGVRAEIINYVPEGYMILPYLRTPDGIEMMKRKRAKYEGFLIKEGMVTKPMQHIVCGNEYDCYITGSDQVWNLSFRENISNEYLFPNLDKSAKRISYAASMGDTMSESDKEAFLNYLRHFTRISVREETCVSQLSELGFNDVQTVLDPTLLLDAADYESLIEEPDNKPNDYLFVFFPFEHDIIKWIPFANMLARNNDLCIVHSTVGLPKMSFASERSTMMYDGIGEFLWYIKHAKAVVTNSYHGAIFGRIFCRPTYVVHHDVRWDRLEQLIKVLGLHNMIVEDDWLEKDWDISNYSTNDSLDLWRDRSFSFLEGALKEG